jgi:hypothetical protein
MPDRHAGARNDQSPALVCPNRDLAIRLDRTNHLGRAIPRSPTLAIVTVVRLRIGVLLWLLSWVPYGIILGLSGPALPLAWTVEIALGIIGLALAGTEFGHAVKAHGWKGAPGAAWDALVHGRELSPEQDATHATG